MIHLDDWVDRAFTKSLNTALQHRYSVYAYVFQDHHREGETYVNIEVACPASNELVFEGEYAMFGTYISTILKDIEEPEIDL